jgi:hypothetical protein
MTWIPLPHRAPNSGCVHFGCPLNKEHSFGFRLPIIALIGTVLNLIGSPSEDSTTPAPVDSKVPPAERSITLEPHPPEYRDWSVQLGVSIISKRNIGEVLSGGFDRAEGDAGGQNYSITMNWVAHRFEIPCRSRVLKPQFEPYLTLTLVDQNNDSIFPDYNGGIGFRWVDFPWNKWVETTFFMGIGLSYSTEVYRIDRERHPDEDRSHLKFDWPIQFTFALPRWPEHQLVLFNDHQSGGHIFDEGGVNSFGIGYRFEF